jgi:anti-anti-sigma factor
VGLHRKADRAADDDPGRDRPTSVLSFHVATATPAAHMQLSGELDEDTVASFGAQLAMLIRTGHRELYLDVAQLSHVSPVCVGVLNRAAEDLDTAGPGGIIALAGLDPETIAILQEAGLHAAIRVSDGPNEPDQRTSMATG